MKTKIEQAVLAVEARGGVVAGTTGDTVRDCYIEYVCKNGHTRNQPLVSILDGRGCVQCARAGRQPRAPKSLPVGTRNGDQEVIEELGVVDGFSMVRVRNLVSGVEGAMTPSDFRRQKIKLLSTDGIAAVLRNNGLKAKGRPNPLNAKHTWAEVLDLCDRAGIQFLHPMADTGALVSQNKGWNFRCHCGTIFSPTLNNVLNLDTRSCGCVKSFAQAEVADFLKQFGSVSVNDRGVIAPYELDIWMPERKLAVEYCGLYWHGEELKGKEARSAHLRKWKLCQELGIRLVTIFEDEWLSKRTVVEGFLKSIVGAPSQRVGARKLTVCEVRAPEARTFLTNHLQGYSRGLALGLQNDGKELLAVAVFARPNASRSRKATEGVWELSRYCVHPQYKVMGGLGKLIAAFRKVHPEATILLSYSDNRWSEGGIYKALGFELKAANPPSYWYFKAHTQGPRFHRFKYRKSEAVRMFGGAGTEWDINSANGLDRIWDCGSMRWELNLTGITNERGKQQWQLLPQAVE